MQESQTPPRKYPKTLQATIRVDARFLASVLSIFVLKEELLIPTKSDLLQFALEYTAGSFISQDKAIPFTDTEKAVRFLEENGLNTRGRTSFYALRAQMLEEDRKGTSFQKEKELSKEEEEELRKRIEGKGVDEKKK